MSRHTWEETALEQQQQKKKKERKMVSGTDATKILRHEEIQRNHSAVPN